MNSTADPGTEASVETVATLVHGRWLLVEPDRPPTALLLGFHGFGELADDSLPALRQLAAGQPWVLAAVQGLHPFYRRNGSIVASWMTSLDRELAIDDNVAYVARVVATLRRRFPSAQRLGCVGFSQGVAMAYRAAAGCGMPCHALLSMAGDVPPELRDGSRPLPPVLLCRGSEDEWYSDAKVDHDLEVLRRLEVPVETCRFEGGHEWTEEVFAAGRSFLAERLNPT